MSSGKGICEPPRRPGIRHGGKHARKTDRAKAGRKPKFRHAGAQSIITEDAAININEMETRDALAREHSVILSANRRQSSSFYPR